MSQRRQLIQLVHIGADRLFSDEESRRDWQEQHTGKRSCSKMTDRELEQLVRVLRDAKVITKRSPKRAGRKPVNPSPYMKKIEALLADMGLSWQYAESIAFRITGGNGEKTLGRPGMQRLEWVHERKHFESIIAALEVEQKKRKLLADIEYLLDALNLDVSYVEHLISGRKDADKWRRNPSLLIAIVDSLNEKLEFEYAAQ
ncbi:E16-like protein [Methylophaga frappieri]|uniref:E16-like protein n=1 Tax=Methylophaga frappieri (strain ATCC BAA-2434 / DSM 25690 / JAM7) TaxID=754477 RepID=I1YGD1_METFJ|nr:regulatory protein GemA [Methylophaga frappieri]AFJ01974.1 E16-like protein [Methylophaga frappieri]